MSLSRSRGGAPRRTLLAAATSALAAALTLSACSGDTNGKSGDGTNFVQSAGGTETVAKKDRRAPGKLAGETLDGKQLDVAAFKGKIVVLNLWGSWCGPCRAEAKYFAKVSTAVKGQGVEFVGINTRDPDKQSAIAFEKDHGVGYPSLYDPDGELVLEAFPKGTLNPKGIPTTIVLDRDGKIAARALEALDDKRLRLMIDPLINEK
ncbi:TlpA disulfide reductase family protein [Streptomyces sp. NPDC000410]|uniref:TlpA family protein disulfide reductase n=1 Tax=Streptomyces sp. NPDC000410 TaxID=3154254 RepID=UPI00333339A5